MANYIRTHRTLDEDLKMSDAAAITAAAYWLVGGAAGILDLGDTRCEFVVVVDISAMDIASTDEYYALHIYGSSSATFASTIVPLAQLTLGDASTIAAAAGGGVIDTDSTPGRYEMYGSNYVDGVVYRYVCGYTDVTGTTPSINLVAYMCKI